MRKSNKTTICSKDSQLKRKPIINADDPEYKQAMKEAKKEYDAWRNAPKVKRIFQKLEKFKDQF